jgi:hypothetical protein
MRVTTRFHIEGSVLRGTLASRPLRFDVEVDVVSPEPEERIARLLRTAERSCYVLQSLLEPVDVRRAYRLNGEALGADTEGLRTAHPDSQIGEPCSGRLDC